VPTATLTSHGGGLFTASYNGFTQTGVYKLVVYATDTQGNQALPFTTVVTVTTTTAQHTRVLLPLVAK